MQLTVVKCRYLPGGNVRRMTAGDIENDLSTSLSITEEHSEQYLLQTVIGFLVRKGIVLS